MSRHLRGQLIWTPAFWLSFGILNAWAGQTGTSPHTLPGRGNIEAGIQGTMLFSQDLKNRDVTVSRDQESYSVAAQNMTIEDDRSYLVGITYGLTDSFSIYAGLGLREGGTFKFEDWENEGSKIWHNQFDLDPVFTWTLGARVRLFETAQGLGTQLTASYQRYDNRTSGVMESREAGNSLNNFEADFWQADISACLYQNLGSLTLFAGVGYEYAELSIAGEANIGTPYENYIDFGDIKNENHIKPFAGLSWSVTDHISLALQGDFVAHNSVYLGINGAF